MKTINNTTGLSQNELIHELAKTILNDMPVRVMQVDETRDINLRIEGVEVIDGEIILIVENLPQLAK